MNRRARVRAAGAAAAVVVAAQVAAALPAHAGTPSFTFHSPQSGQVFANEGFVFDVTVEMTENNGNLIGDVVATFTSPERTPETGETRQPTENARTVRITKPVHFRWNGNYVVSVSARGRSGFLDDNTPEHVRQRSFAIDANPRAPTAVRATTDSRTRHVTISWAPNPEPDLAGYLVDKQGSGGRWVELAATTRTSVTDESTAQAGGTYTYRVRAVRRSAAANQLNPSAPTTTSAGVPAPPPSTTTTTTKSTTTTTSAGGHSREEETETGAGEGAEAGRGEEHTGTGAGDGGTGGSTGGGGRSSGPLVGTGGKVDLSEFQALLALAGQAGGGPVPSAAPGEGDGTYEPTLPFGARGGRDDEGDDDGDDRGPAMVGQPGSRGNEPGEPRYSPALLAGGLLAAMLAAAVVWLRREVGRADRLDPARRRPVSAEARFGFRDVDVLRLTAASQAPPPSARRRRRPGPGAGDGVADRPAAGAVEHGAPPLPARRRRHFRATVESAVASRPAALAVEQELPAPRGRRLRLRLVAGAGAADRPAAIAVEQELPARRGRRLRPVPGAAVASRPASLAVEQELPARRGRRLRLDPIAGAGVAYQGRAIGEDPARPAQSRRRLRRPSAEPVAGGPGPVAAKPETAPSAPRRRNLRPQQAAWSGATYRPGPTAMEQEAPTLPALPRRRLRLRPTADARVGLTGADRRRAAAVVEPEGPAPLARRRRRRPSPAAR